MSNLPAQNPQNRSTQSRLVQPWQTSIDLASLAVTSEEQQDSHNAETLADHEVHQAFQSALNQAQLDVQKRLTQPEARKLSLVVEQRQQTVNQDQSIIKSLQPNSGNPASPDLDLVNAQLDLDTDELKDAQQSLARSLDDQRGVLEQELTNHEAAVKKYDADRAARALSAVATSKHYGTVAKRISAFLDQRTRYSALLQAADQTDAAIAVLTTRESQLQETTASAAKPGADHDTRMNAMKRASMNKRMLTISSDRIENQKQLAAIYRKWAAQVSMQHRIVFHLLMQSLAMLLVVLLVALLLDVAIRYFFAHNATSGLGRQQYSIRVILRLVIGFISAIVLAFLIFGTPTEIYTVLGLTTAGLTVVLQDFIISFCGWFVLMGKRGIRLGDWVEIDGITGEVTDIGIFRTALLETGNWTGLGHPTGRHITFANSFAIKGQYFNFTTNGQWMWDELTVTVPAADAYGAIELIHKLVLEETQADSQGAEDEWQAVSRTSGLSKTSTDASVNMRPNAGSIDIVVRYVTRAARRSELRNILNQRILELIHQPAGI